MKLPDSDKLVVERRKITDYLLNPAHPDNGGKAEFFLQLGFQLGQWEVLAAALKSLAGGAEITAANDSPHGSKFVVSGAIQSPGGKSPLIRTIWILDKGGDSVRLVTAYPVKP